MIVTGHVEKRDPSTRTITAPSASAGMSDDAREIVFAHDERATPAVAVKNVVLQSSLAELKVHGFYERYVQAMEPATLDALLSSIGPGWIPIELALAHYKACDNMVLSAEESSRVGSGVGARLQQTSLISTAKRTRSTDFDLWQGMPQLQRIWSRLYQGGSTQVVKLGPREMLLECRKYRLDRFQYFRRGQVAAFQAVFESMGTDSMVRIMSYSAQREETVYRVSW
jgi:hypothetical protein